MAAGHDGISPRTPTIGLVAIPSTLDEGKATKRSNGPAAPFTRPQTPCFRAECRPRDDCKPLDGLVGREVELPCQRLWVLIGLPLGFLRLVGAIYRALMQVVMLMQVMPIFLGVANIKRRVVLLLTARENRVILLS
jgi:hypothetical protein